jgi:CheY-like chemotaxis protein
MVGLQEIGDIPVVGCSAFDTEADISHALKAGMKHYLPKPVSDQQLNLILSKLEVSC